LSDHHFALIIVAYRRNSAATSREKMTPSAMNA
jgi:hypothetical protein